MPVGDLSEDQRRFVDAFAPAALLPRELAVAWVGCETGWGVTKPNHNYLNVGPGEGYPSADVAAARAAGLINRSDHYAGIRAARTQGGDRIIAAIGASPWGSNPTCIGQVYGQLTSAGGPGATPAVEVIAPPRPGGGGPAGGGGGGGGLLGAFIDWDAMFDRILVAGAGIMLTAGAIGLIALGLLQLAGKSPRQVAGAATTAAGGIGMAKAVI